MIISDGIRCLIPSDTAIKSTELFCSTSSPVSSVDSATWAAWITALGTVALAIFAIFAWNNSRETLEHMRTQMLLTEKRAVLERQLPLLTSHIEAIGEMNSASLDHESDFGTARSRVDTTWMSWSVNLAPEDAEFKHAAGLVIYYLRLRADRIWRWRVLSDRCDQGKIPKSTFDQMYPDFVTMEDKQFTNLAHANNYVLILQKWQTSESSRSFELSRMKLMLNQLK